jgi:hypothetical protein
VIDDVGATKSTGNIACTQANAANDTITFTYGGQTIVLTEGTTGENGFARGADNTACALNLATCINAHSVLGKIMVCTPSVGNCAFAAKIATSMVNNIALSTNDATAFGIGGFANAAVTTAQWFLQHFQLNRTP